MLFVKMFYDTIAKYKVCTLLFPSYNDTIIFLLEPFHRIFFGKSVLETDFTSFPSSMCYVKSYKLNINSITYV